jgi:hypothetical protein
VEWLARAEGGEVLIVFDDFALQESESTKAAL